VKSLFPFDVLLFLQENGLFFLFLSLMKKEVKTAVVILNWNGRNFLENFLPSVLSNTSPDEAEIWVADNGSQDDSIAFLSRNYPRVKCLLLDRNYGFAGGYNRALRQIHAQYYLLLNSDIEVTPGWLGPLVQVLDERKEVAAVMPKIKSYYQRHCFEYAGAAGGFIDRFGYPFCRGRIFYTVEEDRGQYDDECSVFWATGACMLIRSEAFHKAGGFDDMFFAHMEEIDLCWRLKNMGLLIRYTPRSVVYHVGGGTLNKDNPKKTYLNYRNNLYMLYKNLPRRHFFSKMLCRMMLDGISAIKHLLLFQGRYCMAILRAHGSFYLRLSELWRYRKNNASLLNYSSHPEMIKKSIIYHSFFLGKRTFTEIVK